MPRCSLPDRAVGRWHLRMLSAQVPIVRVRAGKHACTRGVPPATAFGCHGIVHDTQGRRGVSEDGKQSSCGAGSRNCCTPPDPDDIVMA